MLASFVRRTRTNGHVGACQMQRRVGRQITVGDLDAGMQRALAGHDFS